MAEALRLMFRPQWDSEMHRHRQLLEAMPPNGRDEKPEAPPRRELLAGGGSLAPTGLQMSLSQNRSAAVCVEPEIDQLLAWFTAESSINSGAPAKLWMGQSGRVR